VSSFTIPLFNCLLLNVVYCEAKKIEEPVEEEMDTESAETSPTTPVKKSLTPAEAFMHRQMELDEAKEQIAALCIAVTSSPEDNVMILM